MKRKLIEINQQYLVVCDNSACDYKVPNPTGDPNEDISMYLNVPCPKCSENLLTEQDYLQSMKFMKGLNFLNKWFSWIMFFVPKNAKAKESTVQFHNGINIKEKEQ